MESARFASQFVVLLCDDCRNDPPPFARAAAYAVYQNELRQMIHLLKYERMRGVAKLLGSMLAAAILSIENEAARDLIVIPVPLFPSKLSQRGFNQSELLAKSALDQLNRIRPLWNLRLQTQILQRIRDTQSQFELSAKGRQLNLAGAFAVEPGSLRSDCEVLLIDDICTTGATIRECSRALRKAGASKVWVATLSRVQMPHIQAPEIAMWDDAQSDSMLGYGIDRFQYAEDTRHSPAS
jgi:ComF family protein